MYGVNFLRSLQRLLLHLDGNLHRGSRLDLISFFIIDGQIKQIFHLQFRRSGVSLRVCSGLVRHCCYCLFTVKCVLLMNSGNSSCAELRIFRNLTFRSKRNGDCIIASPHTDMTDT